MFGKIAYEMIRKSAVFLCLAVVGLCLSSCFKVEEYIQLYRDGSGQVELTVDMSASAGALQLAKNLAAYTEDTPPDKKIDESFQKTINKLQKVKGISEVGIERNDQQFIYVLKFAFADADALNTAMNQFFKDGTGQPAEFFSYSKNTFNRNDVTSIQSAVEREMGSKGSKLYGMDPYTLFKDVSYTTTYLFERKVKSVSNEEAEVQANNHQVHLVYYPFNKEKVETTSIDNRIKLK